MVFGEQINENSFYYWHNWQDGSFGRTLSKGYRGRHEKENSNINK